MPVLPGRDAAVLKTVQRVLARQWNAPIPLLAAAFAEDVLLPAGQRQRPVPAQTFMVVDIADSKRLGNDVLADQLFDCVLGAAGRPVIGEASGDSPGDAEAAVQIPQEHDTGIGRDESAVEADLLGPPAIMLQEVGILGQSVCMGPSAFCPSSY